MALFTYPFQNVSTIPVNNSGLLSKQYIQFLTASKTANWFYRKLPIIILLLGLLPLWNMKTVQQSIKLKARKRGFHLITDEVIQAIPELKEITKGICHVFIQHTSAALTINEDADPTVRKDFETFFSKAVPENDPDYEHNNEGPDDMPAHLKASILGSSVTIPVQNGKLALGTWQGIYLCEHRNESGGRRIVITVWGE